MTEKQQSMSAAAFAKKWEGRGYEKGESHPHPPERLGKGVLSSPIPRGATGHPPAARDGGIDKSTNIRAALVSTNSITQGEQVAAIWKPLKEMFGVHIDFAYRTFRWDSEASLKAHVYCVIVGFSDMKTDTPKLFVISSILGITMLSVWIAFTKP